MKKKAAVPTTTKVPSANDRFSLGTLASDFLDVTWRIAIPVVAFASLGIFSDVKLGSKPWGTLTGTVIGFVIAGLLLKQQLAAAEREDNKKQ